MSEIPKPTNASKESIEKYAERVASQLGYTPGQTDLQEIIQKLGGIVRYANENDEVDSAGGAIQIKDAHDFTIILSRYTNPLRDIFTIAHELGHYCLHDKVGTRHLNYGRSERSDRIEWEANWFASAFLMPEDIFKKKWNEIGNIGGVAVEFGVSPSAVRYRAINLGLLQLES